MAEKTLLGTLSNIATGGKYDHDKLFPRLSVNPDDIEKFVCILEDPEWRKRNVRESNLVIRGDPTALKDISVTDAIKHLIKECK